MKTKLVYVVTCAEDAKYIEQTLVAVWSARYHNPDAHIVLITDDETDKLFVGKRAEILNYISEKVVVPFEDKSLNPGYRSRWLKTSVRNLIKGDYLFIDCDTIVQKSLAEIDNFECEVGASLESNLKVCDFCDDLYRFTGNKLAVVGVDITKEEFYYCSGVMYVKDTPKAYELYKRWHEVWEESHANVSILDQPALTRANVEMGHIIQRIPDAYNCILFTHPASLREAYILHISVFKEPSSLFSLRVLKYIRENGLADKELQEMILKPWTTIMPFDYILKHSTWRERHQWRNALAKTWGWYGKHIDATYADFNTGMHLQKVISYLLKNGLRKSAFGLYMLEKRMHLKGKNITPNRLLKE